MNIVIGMAVFAAGWYIGKKVSKWKEEMGGSSGLF
jgi:hypothetical protein